MLRRGKILTFKLYFSNNKMICMSYIYDIIYFTNAD